MSSFSLKAIDETDMSPMLELVGQLRALADWIESDSVKRSPGFTITDNPLSMCCDGIRRSISVIISLVCEEYESFN
jgi:hypothetical protein